MAKHVHYKEIIETANNTDLVVVSYDGLGYVEVVHQPYPWHENSKYVVCTEDHLKAVIYNIKSGGDIKFRIKGEKGRWGDATVGPFATKEAWYKHDKYESKIPTKLVDRWIVINKQDEHVSPYLYKKEPQIPPNCSVVKIKMEVTPEVEV